MPLLACNGDFKTRFLLCHNLYINTSCWQTGLAAFRLSSPRLASLFRTVSKDSPCLQSSYEEADFLSKCCRSLQEEFAALQNVAAVWRSTLSKFNFAIRFGTTYCSQSQPCRDSNDTYIYCFSDIISPPSVL